MWDLQPVRPDAPRLVRADTAREFPPLSLKRNHELGERWVSPPPHALAYLRPNVRRCLHIALGKWLRDWYNKRR